MIGRSESMASSSHAGYSACSVAWALARLTLPPVTVRLRAPSASTTTLEPSDSRKTRTRCLRRRYPRSVAGGCGFAPPSPWRQGPPSTQRGCAGPPSALLHVGGCTNNERFRALMDRRCPCGTSGATNSTGTRWPTKNGGTEGGASLAHDTSRRGQVEPPRGTVWARAVP